MLPTTAPAPAITTTPLHEVYHDTLAVVYQLPRVGTFFQDTGSGCAIRTVTQQKARVDCPEPSILIRNELDMAGWTVRVDGKVVDLGTSPLAQEATNVPAGTHIVTYAFEPPHIGFALLAALVGTIACIGYGVTCLARRFRKLDSRRPSRRAKTSAIEASSTFPTSTSTLRPQQEHDVDQGLLSALAVLRRYVPLHDERRCPGVELEGQTGHEAAPAVEGQ